MMRVIFDSEPDGEPPVVLDQASLFEGIIVPSILEQGTLFDPGTPERKPAAKPGNPEQRELFP